MTTAFKTKHIPEANLIVCSSIHVKGEPFATITMDDRTGIVSSVGGIGLRELIRDGIISQDPETGTCRIAALNDASPDALAAVWGDITHTHFCTCETEPAAEDWRRFERYTNEGEYTGEHGFACPTCRGIVQIG